MYKMTRVDAMEFQPEYNSVRLNDPPDRYRQIAQEFWDLQDPDRKRRIPLSRLKDRILRTKDADGLANALVIQLLQEADKNYDGFLSYEEYMQFTEEARSRGEGRQGFNRAALSVLPRGDRTVEARRYIEYYRCCPPPFFMVLASLVEIGVFTYYALDMDRPMGASGPAPIYSPLIYNPYRRYEAWRFVSYALIHSGWLHLVTNLVMQLLFGVLLELVHRWWRIMLVYFAGVLAGSLAHSLTAPSMYLAGASGGVYSVMYAHAGNLVLNWSEMEYRWIQLIIIIFVSVLDLSYAFYDTYGSATPSNTGHMAHLGGAIAGVLVGVSILRNLQRRRWERVCWWVSFIIYVILVGTAVVLNASLQDYFPDNDYTSYAVLRADYLSRST
ncbi:rhomboid-related protein 2 isoform X1 [Penaeus vannamei]|uniref:rhomboid-related protein 2 isoform X1 n=1 Tax=Penaeus vannamei TaxID=6689 RepID=UPI000F690527|nr:rhomboid-related protein 2-like isoform X1 [Penaeus vannamei]XP_027211268.1 rhomboid-related protein 2-like isoform X1 [Penaeus vannamei]